MTRIRVPYHLDDHLPDFDAPLMTDATVSMILPDGTPWERLGHLYDAVGDTVADDVSAGQRPVVVSGDCTTSLGIVAGLQRANVDPGVVWFDAHGDVQTVETTASGYLGGMPLRILTGYGSDLIGDRLGLRPIDEGRIVLTDARDLDPPEAEYLAGSAIRRCAVTDLTADILPAGPVYLHIDADVVDESELPGLLYPTPGGPTLDTFGAALRRVLDAADVAAVGIGCTWRPAEGAAERLRPLLEQAF